MFRHGLTVTLVGLAASACEPQAADVATSWLRTKPAVAILGLEDGEGKTFERVLDLVLFDIETWLVNHEAARIVSHARQEDMICELERQSGAPFDPAQAGKLGRQIGAKYFVAGRLVPLIDPDGKEGPLTEAVLYLSVIEVETSVVVWQRKATLSIPSNAFDDDPHGRSRRRRLCPHPSEIAQAKTRRHAFDAAGARRLTWSSG